MSVDEKKDPVASPEPSTASSSVQTPPPAAQPSAPSGEQAAPPPASGKTEATPPVATPKESTEEEVFDRLLGGEPKKETQPAPAATGEEAETAVPDAEAPAGEASAEDDIVDPNEPFAVPTDEELASYHSKTRRRFKQVLGRLQSDAPYAGFSRRILAAAAEQGLDSKAVDDWIGMGFDLKQGSPQAMQALAAVLESHGYRSATQPTEVDSAPAIAVLARLKRDGHIDDAGEEDIKAALTGLKTKAPVQQAPVQRQQAPVQRQQAPQQQRENPNVAMSRTLIDGYTAGHGPKAAAVKAAVIKEITTIESTLDPASVADPSQFASRARLAISRIHQRLSASATRPVQSTLRPGSTPTQPTTKLVPGTPEYEDALMDGRISAPT